MHRDIKTDNLLSVGGNDHTVKLADFGLAILIKPDTPGVKGFAGTGLYMAPEIIKQDGNGIFPDAENEEDVPHYSYPVDVWALGIMTYELLCGETAFEQFMNSNTRLYNAILFKQPHFKQEQFKNVCPEGIDFIKQCLIKDQHKRATVKELLQHPWLKTAHEEEKKA